MKLTRNEFLKLSGITVAGSAISLHQRFDKGINLKLGLASYTFRNFNLDDTIRMALKLNLLNISLKDVHMPLNASADDIKSIAAKVRNAGMNLYGAGVIYMKTSKDVSDTFEYAKNAGLTMIIGVPNHELLPQVNEQVKQYNIRLAIHNHGPGDTLYPSPSDVYEKIKDLDHRIGLCIDIGHVRRLNLDPAVMIEKYKNRLYDIHMKDVTTPFETNTPIEIGRGLIDIIKVIKTLDKIKYDGVVAFEFEKDEKDPLAGLSESVGYVRGVIIAM